MPFTQDQLETFRLHIRAQINRQGPDLYAWLETYQPALSRRHAYRIRGLLTPPRESSPAPPPIRAGTASHGPIHPPLPDSPSSPVSSHFLYATQIAHDEQNSSEVGEGFKENKGRGWEDISSDRVLRSHNISTHFALGENGRRLVCIGGGIGTAPKPTRPGSKSECIMTLGDD